jgi:hypothetical protein
MSCALIHGVRIPKETYKRLLGGVYSSWLFEAEYYYEDLGCYYEESDYLLGYRICETGEEPFTEVNPKLFTDTAGCETVLKAIMQAENIEGKITLYLGEIL